jgi:hypothetical protein
MAVRYLVKGLWSYLWKTSEKSSVLPKNSLNIAVRRFVKTLSCKKNA